MKKRRKNWYMYNNNSDTIYTSDKHIRFKNIKKLFLYVFSSHCYCHPVIYSLSLFIIMNG